MRGRGPLYRTYLVNNPIPKDRTRTNTIQSTSNISMFHLPFGIILEDFSIELLTDGS